jgi:hypothetical protein
MKAGFAGTVVLAGALLAACAGDHRTNALAPRDAAVRTEHDGSDAARSLADALSAWPPADAKCTLRSDTQVKTFFDATGCACAADSSALIRIGLTVGDYCADDPLKGYAASLQVPINRLPATAVYPATERAWTRATPPNATHGWPPQFARQVPGATFSPNVDYRSDAGSGLAFFQVEISHWAGGFDATAKLHQTWSYWSGTQALDQIYGADTEIQGRPARVDAHTVRISNIVSPSGAGGFLDQYALELVVAIADGERFIALIGMIPLGGTGNSMDADLALVCELETIIASYRFESTPSQPTSVCDATW